MAVEPNAIHVGQPRPQSTPSSDTVLIVSHDLIGSHMAGPGIRYLELSLAVGQHLPVILAAPCACQVDATNVTLAVYDWNDWGSLAPLAARAGVILLCGDVLDRFPGLQHLGVPLVVDGYDPHTLETLALYCGSAAQESAHRRREEILRLQSTTGDFFICASERQRDWWLGLLEANGRINCHTYAQDPSLRHLVDVVPFGLPDRPIRHTRQVLKGVWPGIQEQDRVILWGGGIWQWLDPLTALRAVARVTQKRTDVRLVFPGTRHPNSAAVPEMPIVSDARQLAKTLGLLNRVVFFGDWVPHADWPNYLYESDVALSLHYDTVEARLAFRSRVLDYVWAGLPMVVTSGDATSELVEHYRLGETVGPGDVQAVAQALLDVLEEPPGSRAAGFRDAHDVLTWERAAEPLIEFCRTPQRAADKVAGESTPPRIPLPGTTGSEQRERFQRLWSLPQQSEGGRFQRLMTWMRKLRSRC